MATIGKNDLNKLFMNESDDDVKKIKERTENYKTKIGNPPPISCILKYYMKAKMLKIKSPSLYMFCYLGVSNRNKKYNKCVYQGQVLKIQREMTEGLKKVNKSFKKANETIARSI